MKKTERTYEINLNHLTAAEYFKHKDTFEEYKQVVIALLKVKDIFLYENELLKEMEKESSIKSELKDKPITIEFVRGHFPDRFFGAGHRRKNKDHKEFTDIWFDLWAYMEITPNFPLYDLFLCYHLRNTDLLETDDFLEYSLEKYYDSDTTQFIRFLQLALRKHERNILKPEIVQTVNEWIVKKEKQETLSGTENIKSKGKIKRERDDRATLLNQEQTALLIYCLRQTKIILKDENLNNKEAGLAFSVLTGYSADTLRQNLNKSELGRIASLKNVEAVSRALKEIQKFIVDEIKPEEE